MLGNSKTAPVDSISGEPLTTHSVLSLVQYGGFLLLAVNDAK